MNNKKLTPALAGIVLGTLGGPVGAQQDGVWGWSLGFELSTGDYAGSADTDILYVPLTTRYDTGPWSLRLVLPYLSIDGPGNVIRDVGRINNGRGRGAATTTRNTESGIGDVVASAAYNLLSGKGDGPILDLTGKVKLPTADEDKGLGTGAKDVYAQVDVYQPLARQWMGIGTLGYAFLGDAPGTPLDNVIYGSIGASYQLSTPTSIGATFDFRQSPSAFSGPQREIVGFVNHRVDRLWKVQGYGLVGFADGSPDFAIGAGVIRTY